MRVGLIVPHIFMHRDILPQVIFSPGRLALDLADGLQKLGAQVTLFSPGPVDTTAHNITADLSYFEQELRGRGDSYIELLKKHPLVFISLARQVQAELIAMAMTMANDDQLDVLHIYTNEEDIALPFVQFCKKPVVLTHHDPFNFQIKYKNVFPKYKHLNWISISFAQRQDMPKDTNWVANMYHGLDEKRFTANRRPSGNYLAYMGRIIESKGVHLAIAAAKQAGIGLKIAGKHYAGHGKDEYWQKKILPELNGQIEYVGFIADDAHKQNFLGNANALIVPSVFDEPFGMVSIEALACGTPVIALDSGALPEVVRHQTTGFVVPKQKQEAETIQRLAAAIQHIQSIDRNVCRRDFEKRFTVARMCEEHLQTYLNVADTNRPDRNKV